MNFKDLDEFSIWLEPAGNELEKIQRVISELAEDAHVDSFVPHITLLSRIPYDPENIIRQLTLLAQNTKPIQIKFDKLCLSDNPLKCFFLECIESSELMDLNQKAQKLFSIKNEYQPHMSLIYGTIDEKVKKDFTRKIENLGLEYFSFIPKSVSLWHAQDTPKNWKKINEIKK